MIYKMKWKDPVSLKADAGKVGKEIKSLGFEITREKIVQKAEDDKTELHKCFEWNDEKAAGLFRLEQARYILRMLIMIPVDEEGIESPQEVIRVYENVTTDNGRVYLPTKDILENEDWREEVFKEIRCSISELIRKLEVYEHMSGLESKMVKIKEVLETAKELAKV